MRRFYLIGFLALMAFDTLAQISFKVAGEHALPLEFSPAWLLRVFGQPWIYGAFIGYLGAFFTWMVLLKHAPIGPAFAASYLEIVAVLVISAVWFGEPIGWPQILGTVLILGGICCGGQRVLDGAEDRACGAAGATRRLTVARRRAWPAAAAGRSGPRRRAAPWRARTRRFQRARASSNSTICQLNAFWRACHCGSSLSGARCPAVGGAEPALPRGPVVPDRDIAGDIAADDLAMQGLRQRLQVGAQQHALVPVGAHLVGRERILVDAEIGIHRPAASSGGPPPPASRGREAAKARPQAQPARPARIDAGAPVRDLAAPDGTQVVFPGMRGAQVAGSDADDVHVRHLRQPRDARTQEPQCTPQESACCRDGCPAPPRAGWRGAPAAQRSISGQLR